ncbi:transcriptional regulator [Streptomyces sp. G44]|uniref:transcriptional regulator n=1 Tax=Streptomyces sp. G44 TaxID=2807632 RepID=UPI001EF85917|nr:transcriptional regulator [Streptomyces sp. G44]
MGSLAELLRELKGRSGLSYGVLAKRLHMSTSTLHRYCNGDAVPVEFAPVERFARLCKASPEELVEVHRRWILADAARGRKAEPAEERAGTEKAPAGPQQPRAEPESEGRPEPRPEAVPGPAPRTPPESAPRHAKRRRAVAIGAAVALVVGAGSVALALNGSGDEGPERTAGAPASAGPSASPGNPSGKGGREDTADDHEQKNEKPSSSPSRKGGAGPVRPEASRGSEEGTAAAGEGRSDDLGAPITARTRPYVYESPCSQRFLVNRKPNQVPEPPAVEQDAPGWAADLGAVSAGEQLVEVTVQGLGKDTVVLQDMHVRVQSTSSPLAWNDFQMGVGCGGNVSTKSFAVDLDDGTPSLTPEAGQRDFPYKVSESDPEVFYVKAATEAHDVRWYLEVEWSSGKRHNVLRIDDQGKPFRTSGNEGRPTYAWPLGGSKWEVPLGG